jgi:hypothetical protein
MFRRENKKVQFTAILYGKRCAATCHVAKFVRGTSTFSDTTLSWHLLLQRLYFLRKQTKLVALHSLLSCVVYHILSIKVNLTVRCSQHKNSCQAGTKKLLQLHLIGILSTARLPRPKIGVGPIRTQAPWHYFSYNNEEEPTLVGVNDFFPRAVLNVKGVALVDCC